jgi:hypothetical protein
MIGKTEEGWPINWKHGLRKTSEYNSWHNAIARCENPKDKDYKDYGGRGIKICDRWKEDFRNFLEDMGEKPSPKYTLGRINNNGDYDPVNCRWETIKQQNRNKRNVLYTARDVNEMRWLWQHTALTQVEIARKFGITPRTVSYIVNHKTWKV